MRAVLRGKGVSRPRKAAANASGASYATQWPAPGTTSKREPGWMALQHGAGPVGLALHGVVVSPQMPATGHGTEGNA